MLAVVETQPGHSATCDALLNSPLPIPEELRSYGLTSCLNVIAPSIEQARSRVRDGLSNLKRNHPGLPFAVEEMEAALAVNLPAQLLRMMSRVMVLELNVARVKGILKGRTPEQRFASFVDQLRRPQVSDAILREYPVLESQLAVRLDQWANFSLEFSKHLCADWPVLRDRLFKEDPGRVVAVGAGAGDSHRNGRSVLRVGFSSGDQLIYKPRPMAADGHFQRLLAWFNHLGFMPQFQLLHSIDRGDHAWSEFISPKECRSQEEVSRFYWRQGAYLAILHTLEACDFHCENLIAAGEHPLLVDLEALFHPRTHTSFPDNAEGAADRTLTYSVLRVGLLPVWQWEGDNGEGMDISGLGSPAGQLTPLAVPQWEAVDTDEMRLGRRRIEMEGAQNRPLWGGEEVNAFDHTEAIVNGFTAAYHTIVHHRSKFLTLVAGFAHDETRLIVRRTQAYARFLQESFHPDLLRNHQDRDKFFDQLGIAVEANPILERLIAAEHADLRQGDIPLFTARPCSQDVWTSLKSPITNVIAEPALITVERKIRDLSESDLERQLWIVRASLATLAPPGRAVAPAPPGRSKRQLKGGITRCQLVSAACAIGSRLEEIAIKGKDDATWIGLAPAGERSWRIAPLGFDLYDGIPGVALFLAQLGAISGADRHLSLARAAVRTLRRQIEEMHSFVPVGGFNGWGGVIYALTHLGALWSDPVLISEAERIAIRTADLLQRDHQLDVVAGSAGCALCLAALYRHRPSEAVLNAARRCGDRLLETAKPAAPGVGWTNELTSVPLAGFAHGNAGIAYALLVLYELTGETRFASMAHSAIQYERSLFSEESGNWPDLRKQSNGDFMIAWCHGAPGIGLARLRSPKHLHDSAAGTEIQVALNTTVQAGFGQNHSLCHGDAGSLDILVEAGIVLHDSTWTAKAWAKAADILAKKRDTGWICGNPAAIEAPGLMTGLAGIGYGLLRLAYPERVPSILALAPPEAI